MRHWKLAAVSGQTPAPEVRDSISITLDLDTAIETLYVLAEALHFARRNGETTVDVLVEGILTPDQE